jgi:hypothetical protein
LFGRRKRKGNSLSAANAIDLDELIATFGPATNFWETQPEAGVLVRARFADACRDAKIRPVDAITFKECWSGMDLPQQARFGLLVSGLELEVVAKQLPAHCPEAQAYAALQVFEQLTDRLNLLTLDVLQQSDIRLEEFSRHFSAAWGLVIEGETPQESQDRLHAIDFGRLMQEAEVARSSAKDRLAYLRELQKKEDETRRPRRGKW